jgi:hypothetical protein
VYVLRQNCRAAGWRWDTKKTTFKLHVINALELNIVVMGRDFFIGEPRTNSKHYIAVKMDENDDDINIKINL